MDMQYASALVDFLDRDSQTVKRAMMYPITRIELNEVVDGQVKAVRTFVIQDDHWVEIQ